MKVIKCSNDILYYILTLDGDDELRNDGEDLGTTLLEHVEDALHCEETVWVLLLTDALEEDGQIMVVVQLLDLNLPIDTVLGTMLNCDGEVASVVESTELRSRDVSFVEGTSDGLLRCRPLLGLEEADSAATETFALLDGCYR